MAEMVNFPQPLPPTPPTSGGKKGVECLPRIKKNGMIWPLSSSNTSKNPHSEEMRVEVKNQRKNLFNSQQFHIEK